MFSDSYRALRETAAIGHIAERRPIGISGKDRSAFLQGLLTNDIEALTPGSGCYAAWLTPQGRMLSDLHVFESGDMILLDVPAELLAATLQRLEQFLFAEEVRFADLSDALSNVWVHGPTAASILERLITGVTGLADWKEYHNARGEFVGTPVVVACISQLGVPGFSVYVEPARLKDFTDLLQKAGALVAEPDDIEAARIEAGYPLWGADMTDDTIPLEAGIERRAISMTKGCYVGQEVIVRVLHRGHGRVARKLVALRVDGGVPPKNVTIWSGDKEIGVVTSAASSPRLGTVALGYVHRDFTEAGTQVELETGTGRQRAVVSERPMPSTA